jgi:hypothetical protein
VLLVLVPPHQLQPVVLPRQESQLSELLLLALLSALLLATLPEALAAMGPASSSLRSTLRRR